MANGDITITLVGNITNDPELKYTPTGHAVANFTIATNSRYLDKQTNAWLDNPSTFIRCSVWRQYAENVAETLTRGMRVIATGTLKQRDYETTTGEKRSVFELSIDDIGPALKTATAKVTKVGRTDAGGWPTPATSQPVNDPWDITPANEAPF